MLIISARTAKWGTDSAHPARVIRAGEIYPLPRDMSEAEAIAYWIGPGHETFVAEEDGRLVGTYYLRANQPSGGAHVANCGYATARGAEGRGVGWRMCEHSLQQARDRGYLAMQFNFVVSTNERAMRLCTAWALKRSGVFHWHSSTRVLA